MSVICGSSWVLAAGCAVPASLESESEQTPSVATTSKETTTTTAAALPVSTEVVTSVAPSSSSTTTSTVVGPPDDGVRSDKRRLIELFSVTHSDLKPKSIVIGPGGLVFTQNMMYRHNILVFDSDGDLVKKIDDSVDLKDFGLSDEPMQVAGAPVEAAVSPNGRHLWVSNYKMYGDAYRSDADDGCNRGDWEDSYVYRIDLEHFEIDGVVPTGAVPKFLQVSPDGRRLVVANWCSFDVSVIDTETLTESTLAVTPEALQLLAIPRRLM